MKIIGELETQFYKVTVMTDTPPSRFETLESQWIYITKRDGNGAIGRQSIGIGMSSIDPLIKLLVEASSQYRGKRKEFRVVGDEFVQRAMS